MLDYNNSIEQCYKKRKEIISELDIMFHSAKKKNYTFKFPDDKSILERIITEHNRW